MFESVLAPTNTGDHQGRDSSVDLLIRPGVFWYLQLSARAMRGEELYIETCIDAEETELWEATQDPDQHARWDLRFTAIDYLPRPDESEPQEFTYETRIGPGLGIVGGGESTGDRTRDGVRTSSLRFWSEDPKSLIEEGTGYWKYIPEDGGMRFLTGYNYQTRFGVAGRLFDRFVFRPLMVWGTAWSFDRLRLWLEEDVSPEASMRQAVAHTVTRLGLAFVFVYHGLVPKLLGPHPTERELTASLLPAGLPVEASIFALGAFEVVFGLVLLGLWHRQVIFVVAGLLAIPLTVGGTIADPSLIAHPLSPLSIGGATMALAAVGYVTTPGLPSARRCLTDREASPA